MHSFEENNVGLGLEELTEDSDEGMDVRRISRNGSYNSIHRVLKSEER